MYGTIPSPNNKYHIFQHIMHELLLWYGLNKEITNNDFTVLKSLKLLFFVAAASTSLKERSLLKGIFDRFYAMPYGHVESDIYNYIKTQDDHDKYCITKFKTDINTHIELPNIDVDLKNRIQNSVMILKNLNYNLVFLNQFDLVELSHKWDSWKNNFNQVPYTQSIFIDPEQIIRESKVYS